MDIIRLYKGHSIEFVTEGTKHTQPGWVNVACPFCVGNPGYHLGYNIEENYYHCWRCGGHPTKKVIAKLLNIKENEAKDIIRSYGGRSSTRKKSDTVVKIIPNKLKLPSGSDALGNSHKQYLLRRGFFANELERDWGLLGTGPISKLDHINYKHRIIIPIHWNNKLVSFTSRDITDRAEKKYMSCPKDREVIPHKHILYGDQSAWGDVGICAEGPTDVWKLGPMAFATFGIEYTPQQVRVIANTFKQVAIIFDDEPQALKQANKLKADLKFRGVNTEVVTIVGRDPGSISPWNARKLVIEIINKMKNG